MGEAGTGKPDVESARVREPAPLIAAEAAIRGRWKKLIARPKDKISRSEGRWSSDMVEFPQALSDIPISFFSVLLTGHWC